LLTAAAKLPVRCCSWFTPLSAKSSVSCHARRRTSPSWSKASYGFLAAKFFLLKGFRELIIKNIGFGLAGIVALPLVIRMALSGWDGC